MKKINLNKSQYQGIHNFSCPECGLNFLDFCLSEFDKYIKFIIGYSEKDGVYYLVFECPECFTKSRCHTTKEHIDQLNDRKQRILTGEKQ